MLKNAKALVGFTLKARDGEIGKVEQFYFDDHHWTIRYLVAQTGSWLSGRQVLLSPYALGAIDEAAGSVAVDLTKKKIEDSPSIDRDKPVSRRFEIAFYEYYAWPTYYGGPYLWGAYPEIPAGRALAKNPAPEGKGRDSHLRSTQEVAGYHIQAQDGELGHVADFLIDDALWAIRYLVIDTRNWWPGKKVLVSPRWIERVSWTERKVFVNLSLEAIREAPEFEPGAALTRPQESGLHAHYGRPGYWEDPPLPGDYRNQLSARGLL